MKRVHAIAVATLTALATLCLPAPAQTTYQFERMWPTLSQPWYFDSPRSVAVDPVGNVYVADTENHRIQKFDSNGVYLTQWGTNGIGAGQFGFIGPWGLEVDDAGNVYVVDLSRRRIQKFDSDGNYINQFGDYNSGLFDDPYDVAVDATGNLYVVERFRHRVQKFDSNGTYLITIGAQGEEGGGTGDGKFGFPESITVDAEGNLYVADTYNDRIQKFDSNGTYLLQWGSFGSGDGQFDHPAGIAVDSTGNVFVSDSENRRVQKFDSSGTYLAQWGNAGKGDGRFGFPGPLGVAVDADGYVYVADQGNHRIQKFDSDGSYLSERGSSGDGAGQFLEPNLIAVDTNDSVYVADSKNHRIQKFDSDGRFITQWGGFGTGNGQFNLPTGIELDTIGNVYVADERNHRIQRFDSNGTYLSQWGSLGNDDGQFNNPNGIAVDASGNIYVIERNQDRRIQKFDSSETFLTQWQTFAIEPVAIAVDGTNSVYIVDRYSNVVKKYDSNGAALTSWGSTGSGVGSFIEPAGIALDASVNVYVADSGNSRIQIFDSEGVFIDYFGTVGSATSQFRSPFGIALSPNGSIFVSDSSSNRIQRIKPVTFTENSKAIIVAGGGTFPGNDLWEATQASANFAYRALEFQGFTKDSIYYLSSDTDLDLDGNGLADDVDANATNSNLAYAIQTWAGEQLNGLPTGDVVVYLVDHGGDETFRMTGTKTLSANSLNNWLNELESEISGELIVVYDACESGTFQDVLKKPGRTVITSTSPGESAYFLSTGTISFSNFFWTQIFNGEQLSDAYAFAKSAVGQAFDAQTPMVNVDGDGATDEATGDLDALVGKYIGSGTDFFQGRPDVTSVSAPQSIAGTSTATLVANGVSDPDGDDVVRVWAVVRPPNYQPTDSENPIQNLPSVDLSRVGTSDDFTSVGLYNVTIYAMDSNLNVSSPSATTVAVDSPLERKAIIIAGGEQSDPLWPKVENVAGQAYEALKAQGYVDQNIAFRSPVTFNAGVDGSPSLANLEYLIIDWGKDETFDLVLYLVGNGGFGTFEISPSETLLAEDLDSWLDTLQHPTLGIPGKVTVVIDSDFSGSFVPELVAPGDRERIVIGGAGGAQTANFLSGGDISFSAYFWNRVLNGATVRSAFKHAQGAMRFNGRGQRASWDDNGNGIPDEKSDGQVALLHRIGVGVQLAGDDPVIGSIVGEVQKNGNTSSTIYVDDVTTTGTIAEVIATIFRPDGLEQTELELIETPVGSRHYEATYTNFWQKGVYTISVVAIDTDGNASLPIETTVEQLYGSPPPGDAYEEDDTFGTAQVYESGSGGTQSHTFHDDGDEDWYVFSAATDDIVTIETLNLGTNADTYLQVYASNGTTLLASDDDSSPDDFDIYAERFLFTPSNYGQSGGPFYLKVSSSPTAEISPDYGVNATYDIRMIREIGGCEVPGTLKVKLKDAVSGNLLPGATITITKNSTLNPDLAQDGVYVFGAVVNSQYTVSITPPAGYNAIANQNVTPACGALTSVTYTLTPSAAPTLPDIRVTPSSWQFGPTNPGAVEDKVFTVENIGGGTLNWNVGGLAAPFSIIDGGADFDLANGQSETITVRYSPTTSQSIQNDDALMFSGDDPTNAIVSGVLAEAELVADGAALLRELLGVGFTGCADLTEATNAGLTQAYLDVLYPVGNECWSLETLLEFELGENPQSVIYVDFDYNLDLTKSETGLTTETPFNTLREAFAYVKTDDTGEIRIQAGNSAETFSGGNAVNLGGKVMLKRHLSGTVTVGAGGASDFSPEQYTFVWNDDDESGSAESGVTDVSGGISLSDDELAAQYAFNNAIYEAVFPAQVESNGQRHVRPDGTIAVRVRNYSGLDLQRLWAELKPEHTPNEVTFDWIPATSNFQAKDVWIVFRPTDAWYLNDLLEVAAGGETLKGGEVESPSYSVTVTNNTMKSGRAVPQPEDLAGQGVTVYEDTVPDETGNPITVYRIGPDEVFNEPKTVWLPTNAKLMYYKAAPPNDGWHGASDVVGLLGAEPVRYDGGILLTVLHGGVVR